ncbi:MAG: hypothetical protein WKF54_02325 [Nocardioidaceae bacterium]
MKLGIGGGLGPFRLGVSTRGIGGGIGPVSVGGSWRSRKAGGAFAPLVGVILLLAAAYYVIAWPYLLGTWIAVEGGATPNSGRVAVLGWVFEGVYLAGIVWLTVVVVQRRQAVVRKAAEAEQAAVVAARRARDKTAAEASRALVSALTERPRGKPSKSRPGESVLFGVGNAELIAYRVAERNGPRVPTVIERGKLFFSDRQVEFLSDTRTVHWRFDKLLRLQSGPEYLMIEVSGRKTIYGIGADQEVFPVLPVAFAWAQATNDGASLDDVRLRATKLHQRNMSMLGAHEF